MPINIVIEQKQVVINDNTRLILKLYGEVLEAAGFQLEPNDKETNPSAASRLLKDKNIFLNYLHIFLSQWLVDKIKKTVLNADIVLPKLHLQLTNPAEHLLGEYLQLLNAALLEQGIAEGVEQFEEDSQIIKIESKYVLFRELFYRLAAIALSVQFDALNDGKLLIDVYDNFMDKLARSGLFFEQKTSLPLVGHKYSALSKFDKYLTQHKEDLDLVTHYVSLQKKLNGNTHVLTEVATSLRQNSLTIKRQLIGFIGKTNLREEHFLEMQVDSTLKNCEQENLDGNYIKLSLKDKAQTGKNEVNPSAKKLTGIWGKDLEDYQQNVLMSLLQNFYEDDATSFARREKVQTLYELLNFTEYLKNMMGVLDRLMQNTGLMTLTSGHFHFENIGKLLRDYTEVYKVQINLRHSPLQLPDAVECALRRHAADRPSKSSLSRANELVNLGNIELKKTAAEDLSEDLFHLMQMQLFLPEEYQFLKIPLSTPNEEVIQTTFQLERTEPKEETIITVVNNTESIEIKPSEARTTLPSGRATMPKKQTTLSTVHMTSSDIVPRSPYEVVFRIQEKLKEPLSKKRAETLLEKKERVEQLRGVCSKEKLIDPIEFKEPHREFYAKIHRIATYYKKQSVESRSFFINGMHMGWSDEHLLLLRQYVAGLVEALRLIQRSEESLDESKISLINSCLAKHLVKMQKALPWHTELNRSIGALLDDYQLTPQENVLEKMDETHFRVLKTSSDAKLLARIDELTQELDQARQETDQARQERDQAQLERNQYKEALTKSEVVANKTLELVSKYDEKLKKREEEFKDIIQRFNEKSGLAVNELTAISQYTQQSFFKAPAADVTQQRVQQNTEFQHQ